MTRPVLCSVAEYARDARRTMPAVLTGEIHRDPARLAKYLDTAALGLAGEAAELFRALHRGDGTGPDGVVAEAGDCLWYVALFAECLGVSLVDVARGAETFAAFAKVDVDVEDDELDAPAVHLMATAGAIADRVKKALHHGQGLDGRGRDPTGPTHREAIVRELGRALALCEESANRAGVTLDEAAAHNVAKLVARYPDGFKPARAEAVS